MENFANSEFVEIDLNTPQASKCRICWETFDTCKLIKTCACVDKTCFGCTMASMFMTLETTSKFGACTVCKEEFYYIKKSRNRAQNLNYFDYAFMLTRAYVIGYRSIIKQAKVLPSLTFPVFVVLCIMRPFYTLDKLSSAVLYTAGLHCVYDFCYLDITSMPGQDINSKKSRIRTATLLHTFCIYFIHRSVLVFVLELVIFLRIISRFTWEIFGAILNHEEITLDDKMLSIMVISKFVKKMKPGILEMFITFFCIVAVARIFFTGIVTLLN
jgi:hypothetical protein